LGHPVLETRT